MKAEDQYRDYLRERVNSRMNSLELTPHDVARLIAPKMGILETTAYNYVRGVQRSPGLILTPRYTRKTLINLAIFLDELVFGEKDDLLVWTKQLYPDFNYPPKRK